MLLAARGTAGQLLLGSVLVWRAALRTVTLLRTHTTQTGHTLLHTQFVVFCCTDIEKRVGQVSRGW